MYRILVKKAVRFLKQEEGPTAVEYAVVLALILLVCIAAITTVGAPTANNFNNPVLQSAAS